MERQPLVNPNDKSKGFSGKINVICSKGEGLIFGFTFFGRLIMTLYSFHGVFFIYSLIIQFIILIPGLLFDLENFIIKLILSFIYLIFAISCAKVLIIPTYEFLTFPFLKQKNPFIHLCSFIYFFKEKKFDYDNIVVENPCSTLLGNIFFIVIEILYLIGMIMGYLTNKKNLKDYVKCAILLVIYIYYLTIVVCYFFMSLYLIIKIFLPDSKKTENDNNQPRNDDNSYYKCKSYYDFSQKYINRLGMYFSNRNNVPDINLISYIVNPFLMKNYVGNPEIKNKLNVWCEDFCYSLGLVIKMLLAILSIIPLVIIFFKNFEMNESGVYFILFFFALLTLSISFNFPFCFRNRKTFGWCGRQCYFCCPRYELDETKYKPRHPKLVSVIRFFTDSIVLVAAVVFLFLYFIRNDDIKNDDLYSRFESLIPKTLDVETKKNLLPNICYSSIHNIPLSLYLPFINDAYDYKEPNESTLKIDNYKKLFFSDDYEIDVYGDLIKSSDKVNDGKNVKMVQYNVINKKNAITILAIKGTTFNKDIFLDAQLYFSSICLNLLSTFSVFTTKDTYSFRFIEYSLSILYRLFFKYHIINNYMKSLERAYIDHEYTFFNNVVIVGHSLGGGLAKLFGRMMKKQAISLSGPGVNAFHSLWEYEGKSENFEISAIDLVPDKDLVPRVEVSGGTVYRIICKEGILNCHSKYYSLCEVLIMCRNPNYEEYCSKIANLSPEKIKKIVESSELNDLNK